MIVLSVEGDETERCYFQCLNKFLDSQLIQIEVLRHRRGDGYSDPIYVIELLNEYVDVRNGEEIPEDLPKTFSDKYTVDVIKNYLTQKDSLAPKLQKEIEEDLLQIGIDIEYRRYLKQFDNDSDYFAVILDRDCGNHSKELMAKCLDICKEKGYGYYVTNPCFEFWLLMHLCNVKETYSQDELNQMYLNQKVSKRHTVVSREVSRLAGHYKSISLGKFVKCYLPNIQAAIENSKRFACKFPELFDELGTNITQLYSVLDVQKALRDNKETE